MCFIKTIVLSFAVIVACDSPLRAAVVATIVPEGEVFFVNRTRSIDIDGDGSTDLFLSSTSQGAAPGVSANILPSVITATRVIAGAGAARLDFGDEIGSIVGSIGRDWSPQGITRLSLATCGNIIPGGIVCSGEFHGEPAGFLGVEFDIAGQLHYGWIEVSASGSGQGAVFRYAYESLPGNPILAGAVPEPSPMLLVLFAGGVMCFGVRRRRPYRA